MSAACCVAFNSIVPPPCRSERSWALLTRTGVEPPCRPTAASPVSLAGELTWTRMRMLHHRSWSLCSRNVTLVSCCEEERVLVPEVGSHSEPPPAHPARLCAVCGCCSDPVPPKSQ